jgi:amidophosphoribosyltransferase
VSLSEKCGVFGANVLEGAVFPTLYWGMLAQNHRGHQSHGFATWNGEIDCYTQLGLIPPNQGYGFNIKNLNGSVGIANVRYATSGALDLGARQRDAMPTVVKGEKRSIAISFNGNIVNVRELQRRVGVDQNYSDTHALALLLLQTLEKTGSIEEAARACMTGVDGSFAIAGLVDDGTLFAFKDPIGVKPLCYGKSNGVHAFSSESVGFDINGIKWDHELRPGEFMAIEEGEALKRQLEKSPRRAFCAFEFAYFMRPDSRADGKFVYQARVDFGRALAQVYAEKAKRCDIVISLPETADDAAYGFHEATGIPWERATRRHRYVTQRAFITDAEDRKSVIYRKVNILEPLIKGKNLAVIDDSIVRGDTTKGTVKRFRDAGAKEIHLFITYPRIIGPCFYGIDMATYSQLIGARMTPEEISKEVYADSVNYLDIDEYVKCTGLSKDQLCLGCITNGYPTPMADSLAKQMWERIKRGEAEMGRIYESANP